MAENIEKIAAGLGAEIIGQIPASGGGAVGAARLARIYHEMNVTLLSLNATRSNNLRRRTEGLWAMNQLERQLRGAFNDAHTTAISELGFGMPKLMQMVTAAGPTDAARKILPQVTDMFTKLFTHRRLDLSVEAIVLRETFRPLFTEDELRLASERLRESNFQITEHEDRREREAWAELARKARGQWAEENPY